MDRQYKTKWIKQKTVREAILKLNEKTKASKTMLSKIQGEGGGL